jgi:hypothetical protein
MPLGAREEDLPLTNHPHALKTDSRIGRATGPCGPFVSLNKCGARLHNQTGEIRVVGCKHIANLHLAERVQLGRSPQRSPAVECPWHAAQHLANFVLRQKLSARRSNRPLCAHRQSVSLDGFPRAGADNGCRRFALSGRYGFSVPVCFAPRVGFEPASRGLTAMVSRTSANLSHVDRHTGSTPAPTFRE